MKRKMLISLLIGIILSAVALYFAFYQIPFNDLWEYLRIINYLWILPATLLILLAYVLRALRWQIILRTFQEVEFRQAYHPLMVGFMLNCILPGRIGEIVRPLILKRNNKIAFATGLATVAAERVLDSLFLIMSFAIVFSTIKIDPLFQIDFGSYSLNREILIILGKSVLKFSIILLIGIFLVAMDTSRAVIKSIIRNIPKLLFFTSTFFKEKIDQIVCNRMILLLDHAAQGLLLLKHPQKLIVCAILTIVIWLITVVSFNVMALGCPGVDLSVYEFLAVVLIICFFIALPSVPGFWGVWEAGGVFAMVLFGVSHETAAGFTLANHAVQIFPVIIVGLISAMAIGVNIMQVTYQTSDR